jgi:aryl-alcohol dehydrogenase-like predicted oxidoreductase
MAQMTLGQTGITVNKNGFGALPIQRITRDEAAYLLQKAYDSGITFFDTARFYTDSEEKIGYALSGVRDKIIIATKTMSQSAREFWEQLHTSLKMLKTDAIDIYQFHNPTFCPKPGDGSGLYEAMLEAKAQGKIRHVGLTNHRLSVATEAAESGLYVTVQYPFSYLATDRDIGLVKLCREKNIGLIAMKALSGGLITNSAAAYAFMLQYDNVLTDLGYSVRERAGRFHFIYRSPAGDGSGDARFDQ